jgi:predicted negative regulator of RcsB-dependent stress response
MLKKIKRIVILIILAFAAVVGWALYEGSQTQVAHLQAMDLLSEP